MEMIVFYFSAYHKIDWNNGKTQKYTICCTKCVVWYDDDPCRSININNVYFVLSYQPYWCSPAKLYACESQNNCCLAIQVSTSSRASYKNWLEMVSCWFSRRIESIYKINIFWLHFRCKASRQRHNSIKK